MDGKEISLSFLGGPTHVLHSDLPELERRFEMMETGKIDYPYTLGDWMAVEKVEALDCPAAEKQEIFQGNARRLLRL